MEIFKKARGLADPSVMIKHALKFDSPLLCSRLGFFLMGACFEIDRDERTRLEGSCSATPTHFQRGVRSNIDERISSPKHTGPARKFTAR